MKKGYIWVLGCTVIFSVPLSIAINTNAEVVEIEKNEIKLNIPQQYLYKNRFPWIDGAKGLDSSDNSFIIKIPADEIKVLLPDEITQGKLSPIDQTVVVYLLSPEDIKTMTYNQQNKVDEIISRSQGFPDAYAEVDEKTGWYRVYYSPKINFMWTVFLKSPFDSSTSINKDDLLAVCSKDKIIGTDCSMSFIVLGDMAIEMTLREEHLRYYKKVRNYIVDLLQSWRVSINGVQSMGSE